MGETVVEQLVHSFVRNFGPREKAALIRSERVLCSCECEGGGLVLHLVDGPPEMVLERVDDLFDVGVLDVRVFPMIVFVVRVTRFL